MLIVVTLAFCCTIASVIGLSRGLKSLGVHRHDWIDPWFLPILFPALDVFLIVGFIGLVLVGARDTEPDEQRTPPNTHIRRVAFVNSVSEISDLNLSSDPFCALVACDATKVGIDELSVALEFLLDAGMVYLCAWGPDCERVHDLADEIIVGDGTSAPEPDDAVVMTTWHAGEPLDEAAQFAAVAATPADSYLDRFAGTVAIVVANPDWRDQIEIAFAQLDTHEREVPHA